MIYIRTDCNDNIGLGHMMRCFAIAKALRRMGEEATFFVADEESASLAAGAGYGYVCLHTDYDHLDQEADRLLQHMRERNVERLLVDSYFVTGSYLKKIRDVARLAYIDDVNRFIYPCDLLIDYNIYSPLLRYEERYKEAGLSTRFALGTSYMPLDPIYMDLERIPHEDFRILVTTGATDAKNVLGSFLAAYEKRYGKDLSAPSIYAVIGRFNHHRDDLVSAYGKDSRIHLLPPQPDLTELIASCDLALTAGGTTVYELCAGGVPSVLVTIADNQMMAAKEFDRQGIIPYAGDIRTDMEGSMEKALNHLEEYRKNPALASAASEKMRTVVDGHGAERIAKLLLTF